MSWGGSNPTDRILEHLAEIGARRCTITDEQIVAEPDPNVRQVLLGLLVLDEDLAYASAQRAEAEAALRAANEALRQSERLLEEKVRARTRELSDARDAALTATNAKSAFLANMSHELRTPLNAIIGYSEMLHEDAVEQGRGELAADLDRIHVAGKHLLSLINDVLDLSKVEAGRMDLRLETYSVPALVEEVHALIQPMVKPGVRLDVRCDAGLGDARADPMRVRQGLFNLLSNACKFTEGGQVALDVHRRVDASSRWLVFRVSDTGIGMTAEEITRIFQPFSQASATTSRKYGGTGLGLALSRRFCQLMGGDITVSSEVGTGSTFAIVIPEQVAAVDKPASTTALTASPADAPSSAPGATILVIDDDASTLELIARLLEKEGYRVLTALDAEEGLRLARQQRPSVITLDVMMPHMNGWDTLAALRADPILAGIPVVLVTILDQKDEALARGALDVLTKPIERERLAAAVNRAAGGNAT